MPPVRYDTRIYPGETFETVVQVSDDLTDWSAVLQVRRGRIPRTIVATLDSIDDDEITVTPAGRITVRLPATFTINMPSGRYVYDLDLHGPAGDVRRILSGVVIVRRR
jgi:hypothetical protein